MAGGLAHRPLHPAFERVVAGIGLQRDRGLRVADAGFDASGHQAEAGGDVQAGQLRDVRSGGRGEDLLGPPGRLVALQGEGHEGGVGGDGRGAGEVALVGGPAEARSEVGELRVDPVGRGALAGPVPHDPVGHGLLGEVGGVAVPDHVDVAGRCQPILGELADRLQQPVAGMAADLLGGDERLAHQGIQQVQHRVLVEPASPHR